MCAVIYPYYIIKAFPQFPGNVPANNPADADEILSAASEQIEISTVPVRVQPTTTVQKIKIELESAAC